MLRKKNIFDFPEANTEDINKIIKSLNPNKATGPDHIPLKIIKTAANVIDSHLAHIINKDLKENKFSENVYLFIRKMIGVKVKTIDKSVFQMVFPKFMKYFYMIVYPTSEIRYFPNLFQLIESLTVQIMFF